MAGEKRKYMKMTIEDKINTTEKQIKISTRISIAAVVVLLALYGTEFVVASFFGGEKWAKTVIRICIYLLYVMPFAVVVPLFFRVNLKGKLYRLKQSQNQAQDNDVGKKG